MSEFGPTLLHFSTPKERAARREDTTSKHFRVELGSAAPAPKFGERGMPGDALKVGLSVRVRRTFALSTIDQTFATTLHVLMWWETNEEGE